MSPDPEKYKAAWELLYANLCEGNSLQYKMDHTAIRDAMDEHLEAVSPPAPSAAGITDAFREAADIEAATPITVGASAAGEASEECEWIRIEPVESFGKWCIEVRVGDDWKHLFTGYRCEVDKMEATLKAAVIQTLR